MTDGFSSVVCNTDMTSCPLIRARPNSTFARQTDFDRECRNGEEVHCGDGFPMIVQKSEPTLGRPRVSQGPAHPTRSEEHTSELQSRGHLVCRLLLEKKKL